MELRDRLQSSLGNAYSLDRELGGGGMSRIYVARDTTLGRDVVVKVLAPELAADVSAVMFLPRWRRSCRRFRVYLSEIFALVGDNEEAVRWLRHAMDGGFICYPLAHRDPLYGDLLRDPGFVEIIETMRVRWEAFAV